MQTITFTDRNGFPVTADLHTSDSPDRKNRTIVYFHGGGLLFGTRKDLPIQYLNQFLQAGYDVAAFDYPLAPEHALQEILDSNLDCIRNLFERGAEHFILFGRSAGAYLSLMLADRLRRESMPLPDCLLLFYGYYSFLEKEFLTPAPFYKKLPEIDLSEIDAYLRSSATAKKEAGHPLIPSADELSTRFTIYAGLRQQGNWPAYIAGGLYAEADPSVYSLSEEALRLLPPAFITASTGDEDVPYRASRNMSRLIPDAQFHPVYYLPHDFDRAPSAPGSSIDPLSPPYGTPEGREVYSASLFFMEKCFSLPAE